MGDYHGGHGGGRGGRGGYKRPRDDAPAPMSPYKQLLAALIAAGDDAMPSLQVDPEAVTALAKAVRREARSNVNVVLDTLLDCAVQLSHKVPLYALLVGVINAEEPDLVRVLVTRGAAQYEEALKTPAGARRARLLLRFFAALVVAGVLQAPSVVAAARRLVDAAAAAAAAGGDGRAWQPYADVLVNAAVRALPFGGPELAESDPEGVAGLMAAVDAYMAARPRASQPSLRPFSAAIKDDDALAESDCGAASHLAETVGAVKQVVADRAWELQTIPRVHQGLEATLATAQPHVLPFAAVPQAPPVAVPEGAPPALAGALVLDAYPPRGIIRLLDRQHTEGERPLVERHVTEDYMLDTITYFEGDRVECAKRLARNLPVPFPCEPLLCEVIFSQMLRVPKPEFKPIMYATLMVDMCKLQKVFPRAMSACVRECFARMNVMDPALRVVLAEWLAYHLSNFEYVWPWAKWQHVLEAPPYDGQRRFCVAVMNRLVRLSYWDRVQSVLPEEFRPLLPPKPEPAPLPAADGAVPEDDLEGYWAAKALQQVRSKVSAEELDAWVKANTLETVLGGPIAVVRMLCRCLLVAGAKSYTHMVIALERYYGPLAVLAKEGGLEAEAALVETTALVWARSPQRASMAVDRLMTLRLVSAEAIIAWFFKSPGVQSIADETSSAMAWEIMFNAVNKTIARVQDATEELAGAQQAGEDSLAEKETYLKETLAQRQAALLQVMTGSVRMLCELGGASGAEAMDADASEQTALYEYMLASLKSYVRRYNVLLAELVDKVEGILDEAPADLKEAVLIQMNL